MKRTTKRRTTPNLPGRDRDITVSRLLRAPAFETRDIRETRAFYARLTNAI